MVEKKAKWIFQEGSGLATFPPSSRGPRPPPLRAGPPSARGPAPNPPLPGDPAPLPSLHTQAPSTGEQAIALAQEQRALQATP